jgi:hypothetical protein
MLVAFVSCVGKSPTPHGTFGHGTLVVHAEPGSVRLSVRIAATTEAQRQGLMGEADLAENSGMAFVHDQPSSTPFWMKDTTIPLSIAFWNRRYRIVDILDMAPCTSDSCPLYRSPSPYIGAVEVNQGFFDRHEVRIGDTVQLNQFGYQ